MLSDEASGSSTGTMWNALSPNDTARVQWIDHAVRLLTHFPNGTARQVAVDGISFDYEDYTTGGVNANGTFGGDSAGWYVPLMAETKRAMRRSGMPLPMINWDVSTKAAVYAGWNMSATDLAAEIPGGRGVEIMEAIESAIAPTMRKQRRRQTLKQAADG